MKVEITNLAKKEFRLLEPFNTKIGQYDICIPIGFTVNIARASFLFKLLLKPNDLFDICALKQFAELNGFVLVRQSAISPDFLKLELDRQSIDAMISAMLYQAGMPCLLIYLYLLPAKLLRA